MADLDIELDRVTDAVAAFRGIRSDSNRKNLFDAMTELADTLMAAADLTSLADFFRSVGDGVIDAQKYLDAESNRYRAAAPATAPAGHYHIPKATAEFRFAIRSRTDRGFDVLVYRNASEQRREHEQRITFDVVSVPPPPEIRPGLDADGFRIKRALQQLASVVKRVGFSDAERKNLTTIDGLRSAIIHDVRLEGTGGLLVLFAGRLPGTKDVDVLAVFAPDAEVDKDKAAVFRLNSLLIGTEDPVRTKEHVRGIFGLLADRT